MSDRAQPLILVVEDDDTQRILATEVLRSQGFAAKAVSDGAEGLRAAKALKPDLVISDIMMPGIDGFVLCRAMRDDPELAEIPVLIVTGLDDTGAIGRGFEAGAKDFMTKPINWDLLGYRIRFVLRSSEMSHELRVARDAAEASSAAKSAFLAMVTHELRTPLNAVIGFSDVMRLGIGGAELPERYRAYVDDIHQSGLQLLALINDVLEMSHLDRGKFELQEDMVDLASLLEAAIAAVRPNAEAGGIALLSEDADALPILWADTRRLREAIGRLLANAVKFTPREGTVVVKADVAPDGAVRIAVRDTGIGMSEADLARMIQPFQQADMRLGRNYGGLGLGIPLALGLIKLHGGSLDYVSAPGQGTTATITLPASRIMNGARGSSRTSAA